MLFIHLFMLFIVQKKGFTIKFDVFYDRKISPKYFVILCNPSIDVQSPVFKEGVRDNSLESQVRLYLFLTLQ